MLTYLNKGISTPRALSIILIFAIIVGGFAWWQYVKMQEEGAKSPEVKIPEKKEKIVLYSGCNDLVDLWSNASKQRKTEECQKILNANISDLENKGLKPEDCEIIEMKAESCPHALGTRLSCLFSCRKEKAKDVVPSWKTYRNEEYGFEIKYPLKFSFFNENKEKNAMHWRENQELDGGLDIYIEDRNGKTVKEWIEEKNRISGHQRYKKLEDITVDGSNGIIVEDTHTIGEWSIVAIFPYEDYIFEFGFMNSLQELKQILSTFRSTRDGTIEWETYLFDFQELEKEIKQLPSEDREEMEKKIRERRLRDCSFQIKYPKDWIVYTWPLHGLGAVVPDGIIIEEKDDHTGCYFSVFLYGAPEKEKYCFPISYGTGGSDRAKCSKIFNQMLSTFRFLE